MIVTKYKFNPNTYADYLPEFNSGYTSYTKSDITNSDGTITRTIESNSLPTYVVFGNTSGGGATDKTKALLEVISLDLSNVSSCFPLFLSCTNLKSALDIKLTSKTTNTASMFNGCSSLTSLDLSNWDTSNVTNIAKMFYNCTSLTSLSLSNWDTSNVTNMGAIFQNCSSLTSLGLNSWNTSKVTSMANMFNGCSSLTSLDLNNWDTSQVNNMSNMFYRCTSLTQLDISSWDTSKVVNINTMFQNCSSLISLNINNWDTSRVTNMASMFQYCSSLTSLDLSNWDTSNVIYMVYMFNGCSSLTQLDLSKWDTSNVTNMSSTFSGCSSLYKVNLKYANQSTISKIHENLPDRSSSTKGYILSSSDLTSNKNWQRIKSSHNRFYLPQPLNKIGDIKDRFYWDEDKGHYCIEENIFARNFKEIHSWNWKLDSSTDTTDTFKMDGFNSGTPFFPTVWGGKYITSDESTLVMDAVHLFLKYPKSKFNSNVDSFKDYLNSGNLTVHLQRYNKPIIIDLPHMNQKLTFDSYNPSTTIDIPNRPLKASKTYLDAPIARYRYTNLQPNTQYNVQFDCKGDIAIKVNLGGTEVTFSPTSEWSRKNLTITTPSELVNDKLSISNVGITSNNKVDNVMLFSEVIAQEPDYIDAIQSIGELQSNGTYKIDITTYEGALPLTNISYDYLVNAKTFPLNGWTCVILPIKTSGIFTLRKKNRDGSKYRFCIFNTISNTSPSRQNYRDSNDETFTWESDGNWVGVGFITDYKNDLLSKTEFSLLCENKGIPRYPQPIENQSTHSIYLPQPLRKRDNAKDKFYWDDDKGHYCIEQNIGDNLEVLSSPNIIDLTEMNQKFTFDTYLPNTYVDVTNLPLQPCKLQLEDDTVRYKTTIEPSTLYTIQFNCLAKSTTNLTLDLGGSRVTVDPIIGVNHVQITTPSVLASDRLFLIGTGIVVKEVIVNKGNMIQYPKYFDGEQDVGELQEDGSYIIRLSTDNYTNLWEGDL